MQNVLMAIAVLDKEDIYSLLLLHKHSQLADKSAEGVEKDEIE